MIGEMSVIVNVLFTRHPAEAGVQACPWQGTGGNREALGFLDSRFRGNDD